MKRIALPAAALAMLACGAMPVLADEGDTVVTIDQLQANPTEYLKTDIVVRGMACKLAEDNEYTCISHGTGKSLVIHAKTLSYGTSTETALQFGDECRGEAALLRKGCIYDVRAVPREIRSKTIRTSRGEELMIMSFGHALDLMPPKKKR